LGYLTTFTIYNDGINLVKENAQDFANKIHDASTEYRNDSCEIAIGSFCNLVKVQKTRHADDHTVYVHMGNTILEMNPRSEETIKLAKRNPEFFKRLVEFLEEEIKKIKEIA